MFFLFKPDQISEAFAYFYKKLYANTETCTDLSKIEAYLQNINIPTALSQTIDEPITEAEIKSVIKK